MLRCWFTWLMETLEEQVSAGLGMPLSTPIRQRPVNSPTPAWCRYPVQLLRSGIASMMVQRGGSLVEPASVPGIVKLEFLEIEVMAEFMAKGAQKRTKGCDLLSYRRTHPDSDQHSFGRVVSEKFGRPTFTNSQWSGGKHADSANRDLVELGCGIEKFLTGTPDLLACSCVDCRSDGSRG